MKYFFDTEFIEDGKTIDLLSIGIVAEDGRELYGCCRDTDLNRASLWVAQNVFPHLPILEDRSGTQAAYEWDRHDDSVMLAVTLRNQVREFVDQGLGKPEFWGYYADYDWVVLCQLFGRMIDLPKGWPMYCNDIKQLCKSVGDPVLPKQFSAEHHALHDARWTKEAYFFLQSHKEKA